MDNVIELKRGIFRICHEPLMEEIASLENFEAFYSDIFNTYKLQCTANTFRQKRSLVAAATKYYIIDRLPKGTLFIKDDKYNYSKNCNIHDLLTEIVEKYYEIHNECETYTEFMAKYAKYYNVEIRDFSKEILENREDSLSNFAKAIEKIYHNSKD